MSEQQHTHTHTPGPWVVHSHEDEKWGRGHYSILALAATPAETVMIAEINTTVRNPWKPPVDGRADALLIAAAPDLLAACEALLAQLLVALPRTPEGHLLTNAYQDRAISDARAAVARAKGVTP